MQTKFNLEGKPTQDSTLSDPHLKSIYNSTGNLIPNTANDDDGTGYNSRLTFTATTNDTYCVSVGAYSGNTGTYTLTTKIIGNTNTIKSNTANDDDIYDAKIIQWTSFNKPKHFAKNNNNDATTFVYDPNRSRYQKTQTKASSNTTITTYIGKLYEQIKQNTSTEHKHFIYADGQLIAINIKTDTTAGTPSIPDKTRYLHYDNLGSIDTITNGQGNIVERMAYTAFGQRRQGDWRASDPLLPIIPALTNRGFTGHEHIDEMGFIHMNGRVYDPSIGRFLSADPNIQAPYNTQSYNRYSYVINNPLKYTDPDGYFFVSLIAAVITKAIVASSMHILIQVAIAYTISYAATYIATGNAKAAQGAGLAAGLFMGIGGLRGGEMGANGKMQYNPGWEAGSLKTLAAHGLAGGIVQDRMGGSFGAGFLAGSAGSYLGSSGNAANTSELVANTITDAVVGGAVSVIGGGKFANGAQTGAFRYLFNESMHSLKQGVPISDNERILSQNGFREEFWENRDVRGDPFAPTALEVVNDSSVKGWFANALSPFNNKELGLNLMVDYVNWIDRDYADTNPNNWSGVLSNDQITNWHDYSFNRTPWATGYIGNLGPKSWVCSPSCDSYSPEQ